MKVFVSFLVTAFIIGCNAGVSSKQPLATPTDRAFVERFLRVWLVKRDLVSARKFIHPRFTLNSETQRNGSDSAELSNTSLVDRTLQFPFRCAGFPSACPKLDVCIRAATPSSSTTFEMSTVIIDRRILQDNPSLRPFEGKSLVYVMFTLEGCNTGVSMLLLAQGLSDARVVQVFYLAG
jgi:hypothetical protein